MTIARNSTPTPAGSAAPAGRTSLLFRHIEHLNAGRDWGRFLDAGTGVNSALWSTALPTGRWVGVTGSASHAAQVEDRAGARLRSQDRLLVGNWTDPDLLKGDVFDTVLADYLVGAVEGFSPYFQERLFSRLRPHVGRWLYVVGLDPYVVGSAPTQAARIVRDIGRVRDACLLLADETPYREYPAEWVVDTLRKAGFAVSHARRFPNRYHEKWVHSQLDMAARRLPRMADEKLAEGLRSRIETLRERGTALCRAEGGLRHGADYVIACTPG
ncbi:MAG: class I SAM-dependent methyltransferase [Rhizobiaceae bacterium]|nr:class I SAM-dependent methyltransferase [Rhizobiaceae bacterium]MCV0404741.1 class I SAM-dependent methyltransferase [Rhizobiaceae bacterium]